jgi:hypothetical protein
MIKMKEFTNYDLLGVLDIIRSKTSFDLRMATIMRDTGKINKLLIIQSYLDDLVDNVQEDILNEEEEIFDWGF